MAQFVQRTHRLVLLLVLLLTLASCMVPIPAMPSAPTPTQAADPVADFSGQLMLALVEHDYTALQQMMGNPFTLAYWQAEGASLPPGVAIADLRSNYLPEGATFAFNTTTDLTALLGGVDPLSLWGPAVDAVKAIYLTGLGADHRAEAILVIARDATGKPYWHGMLVAADGFTATGSPTALATEASPTASPTLTPLPTMTATATNPPPTATQPPPPDSGLYPTEVRYLLVLQNVNVRNGPDTQYSRIGRYMAGQVIDVFGANANRTWWNVRCPNGTVGACWVVNEADTTQPTSAPTPTPPPPPPGQPIRIRFPAGGTSATVQGTVRFPDRVQYVLQAAAGQEMTVEIRSPGDRANFAITGVSDGQPYKRLENEDRSFTFRLPTTQDYLISVATPGGTSDFALRVTVVTPGPTPPPAPTRIQFPPGGTTATVNGLVRPPDRPQYVLKALAGQEMTVQIISPGNLANFAITGVSDGQPYKRLENEDRSFTFTLPATQDYLITVASAAGAVDYSLTVTVVGSTPPPPTEPIRIRFAPGATSATVEGSLAAGAYQEYLVAARAGQQMTVDLYAAADNTLLAITGADGTPYKRGAVGGPSFTFTLPTSQDYIISVIADGNATGYTLVVTIY